MWERSSRRNSPIYSVILVWKYNIGKSLTCLYLHAPVVDDPGGVLKVAVGELLAGDPVYDLIEQLNGDVELLTPLRPLGRVQGPRDEGRHPE